MSMYNRCEPAGRHHEVDDPQTDYRPIDQAGTSAMARFADCLGKRVRLEVIWRDWRVGVGVAAGIADPGAHHHGVISRSIPSPER